MDYVAWLKKKIEGECWANKTFMIYNGRSFSFSWFFAEIEKANKYIKSKIRAGETVGLKGECTPYTAAIFLALIDNHNIVVPITSGTEKNINYYLEVAEVQHLLSFDDGLEHKKFDKTVRNGLILNLKNSGRSGLVLFTSGSTGNPKGSLHNLDSLLEKYTNKAKKAMSSLVFLRLDHIGGINTFFSLISNGGTMVVVKDRTPKVICEMIERHKVELLPTTPSFLNMLLVSEVYLDYDLSSLRLITYGTEVMPESLLRKLIEIFKDVDFKQTYGMTEVGILSSKSKSSHSTWLKIGGEGYQIKVVDGILWIKAETSILGYLNAPSPFNKDGWLKTNDRVAVDDGYFRFIGREEEIINIGGLKVYPAEVEDVLLLLENVKDIVVFGEKSPILGNIVCARVVLKNDESLDSLRKRIYAFCKDKLERYKIPQKVEISDNLYNERFKKNRLKDEPNSSKNN